MIYRTDTTTYCWNPEEEQRVLATYQVYLSAPASCDGFIEIEATSSEEAARLALDVDHFGGYSWDYDYDPSEGEVVDVECENPPTGAILHRARADNSCKSLCSFSAR